MDEIWARVGLVAAALAVAGSIAVWQRGWGRARMRDVSVVTLEPGTYYFSSASCPTCAVAREKLDQTLGDRGYVEFSWEEDPGVFAEVGVDAVPAVLIVNRAGRGRLYPGQPERALAEL